MSSDILQSICQGEKDAKAAERAKRAGARAGRGGRSKSCFSRSAGRAAVTKMKIRGRGLSLNVHKNGKSFKRRGDYIMDAAKGAELIYANSDIRSMRAAANLRPDIKEPVGHISASLPPSSGKRTKEEWLAIAETVLEQLGLDDTFPVLVARHQSDHDHIHFEFSRVSVTGKVHDQANIGLRCAAIERILEDKHNLKLVPPSEFKKNPHGKLTKNEIEMANRKGELPPRAQIAAALKVAVQGRPTVQQFVERLNASGIGVKANVSPSTGRMNGFSFIYEGVPFSGSQVSKEYGWKALSERIDYEQEAGCTEFLRSLDGEAGRASVDLADSIACIDGLDRAVATVNPAAVDPPAIAVVDTAVTRPTSQATKQPKPAQPARVAKPVPDGFRKSTALDIGLIDWAGNLSNRIARRGLSAIQKRQRRYAALLDARDSIAAIAADGGYAIPEPKILSDEQIVSLIRDLGGEVEIRGTPDFCERVEKVASTIGLNVHHEYQVTAEEKKAANERIEARQREEYLNRSVNNVPGYRPSGV